MIGLWSCKLDLKQERKKAVFSVAALKRGGVIRTLGMGARGHVQCPGEKLLVQAQNTAKKL